MNWNICSFNETIGFAAALLVLASLCQKNIKGLRILSLAGSLVFLVYGFLIFSPSILALNIFASAVNVFRLFQIKGETSGTDLFDALFVDSADDEMLKRFIRFHGDDIRRFFPSFNADAKTGTLSDAQCCFILRETLPVSLIAYKRENDKEVTILVDYVIPAFRDLKNGEFFFSTVVNRIASPGTVFLARGEVKTHITYLKRIGFTETGREGKTITFCKTV